MTRAVRFNMVADEPLPHSAIQARGESASPRRRVGLAESTLEERGLAGLAALSAAVGFELEETPLHHAFRRMVHPWGEQEIGERPRFSSDASNDGTPFEYSVAFGRGAPELRFMVEAQGEVPTLGATQLAGRALTERLAGEFGAPLDRLRAIEAPFFPEQPEGRFAVWHAASWRPGGALELKIYLNLQIRGRAAAPRLLREAMERLGMAAAWRTTYGRDAGRDGDELVYFSLDLSTRKEARIKVYTRHPGASADELEAIGGRARGHQPGDATLLCRAMTGGDGPFTAKPVITCFSFTGGDTSPRAVTTHFPISAYAPDDLDAFERIRALLARHGLPTEAYERAVLRFAGRGLAAGSGMQSYASFRREGGSPRVTVYLGPEAYSVAPPRSARR